MLELDKIYNMDCLEGMKQIDDNVIDMVLCDLPYGITVCKWDKPIDLKLLWEQYKRIIKKNSIVVLTACQPYTTDLINSNRKWFKYEWIWNKTHVSNFFNAYKRPLSCHENILIFSNGRLCYNPQSGIKKYDEQRICHKAGYYKGNIAETVYGKIDQAFGKQFNDRIKLPKSILNFKSVNKNVLIPTQKPLELFEYLIKTYSNEGDLVLDNCMGSGTTAVACKRLNRRFIGFEINKEYYDISLQRLLNVPERLEKWIQT